MPRSWFMTAACALVLVVSGCSRGHFSQRTSAGSERIFRYSLTANPTHLDPALVQDGATIDVLQQVFEGLVCWSDKNVPVGNLAVSWSISPDGKTYTFKLRKGVTFSDGRPFTAADVKFSMERACHPRLKSETAEEYLGDIVGVSDYIRGRSKEIRGISVVDDGTLSLTIEKPIPYFVDKLTYPCAFVVSRTAAPKDGEMIKTEEMIGTGPFVAARYVEDQVFELKANTRYHGGAPLIDGIERPILKDGASRLDKYKAGELDLVQLDRTDIDALTRDPAFKSQLHVYPRPDTFYAAFNPKAYPPFANRDVRRAFAMAVETRELASKTLHGLDERADGILPPGVMGRRTGAKTILFDPEQAKRLLAQAGFANPARMPPLDLYIRGDNRDARIVGEAVQSYFAESLGVSVTLKPLDWTTFLEKRNRHELPMFILDWSADYLDPENFISLLFSTTGKGNRIGYSNLQVDSLCVKADSMLERDPQRLALYAQAEDLILQDAPWIPLYFGADRELISPRVSGLRDAAFGHLPHATVSLRN